MAENDNLTGFLPDPPPPDGDRRSKAIEAALRRFDDRHGQPNGDDRALPPASPVVPNKTKIAVLASAALVILVTVPLLMTQRFGLQSILQGPQPVATERGVSVDLAEVEEPNPPLAEAPPAETLPPSAFRTAPPDAAAPPPPAQAMIRPPVAVESAENLADTAEPQVARAAPEKPQSLPALAPLRGESADSAGALVVTGSRVSRREAEQAARDRRLVPTGRQISEWRACTVADGRKDARLCATRDRTASGAAEIARGLELSFRGDDRGALKAFDAALALAPGSTTALLNRALVRQRLGDRDGALADFDGAIRSSPADARSYYFRSLLRRRSGDGDSAEVDLATAIDLAGGEVPKRR